MATSGNVPKELDWPWQAHDRFGLIRRFRQELVGFLKALSLWSRSPDGTAAEELRGVAERFDEAAAELDICAANCHAMAATLNAHASGDGFTEASPDGAVRLRSALGQNVMLTHTTIEQLMGKHVRLEYLDGANAIVQLDGEYWGTPLDRVLVVPPEGYTDAENPAATALLSAVPAPSPAPLGGAAFQFVLRGGELSNAIQFLTMTSRAGALRVRFPEPLEEGQLLFKDRRVTGATFGEHEGIEAVARMMNLDGAVAVFTDGSQVTNGHPLHLSTEQLLIEAAVKADELNYLDGPGLRSVQPAIQ